MSTLHFLNVNPGDCTIIQHNTGHITMVDICCGNQSEAVTKTAEFAIERKAVLGNFQMCNQSTNPLAYLKGLGITDIFRFILTHPDMDHLDGFNALMDGVTVSNYWDSEVRREKPAFGAGGQYLEADWDKHVSVRDGKESAVTVVTPKSGSRFKYANKTDSSDDGGDGLHILAPDKDIVDVINNGGDVNDGSYVLLYHSAGGKIIIPGDAHDATWDYVLENHKKDIEDASILIAPHHGRGSNRNYDFLDAMQPKLSFFGCAPSKDLDYAAWSNRGLEKITSNQAGNIVLESHSDGIDVYIENTSFADKYAPGATEVNTQGYRWIKRVVA